MLVKFAVENFRSFRDEVVLDMVASSESQHKHHVIEDNQGKKVTILRAAAIYGANASGKSNLVGAISFARDFIINGTKSDQKIPIIPFKLDSSSNEKPSKFEFIIKYQGILYTYGFVIDKNNVLEEWLHVVQNKREAMFFERLTTKKDEANVKIGPSFAKENSDESKFLQFVAKGTRPNQLFLTEANEKNVSNIKDLLNWFKNVLVIITADQDFSTFYYNNRNDMKFIGFVGDFLRTAGTGIEAVDIVTEEFKFEALPDITRFFKDGNIVSAFKSRMKVMKGDPGKQEIMRIKTRHGNKKDKIFLEILEESDGTQRLLDYLPFLYSSCVAGDEKVLLIDELDRSMHPLLSRMIMSFFLRNEVANKGQMIFTTHDTNLLDKDLLRRDEIWFMEKDKDQNSHLYSLADFKVRPDLSYGKGYLQGRFGAIPFIGDFKNLCAEI